MFPQLLQMAGNGGHHWYNNRKQESEQTVLTIMKTLTKMTNCTCREPKEVEGHNKKCVPAQSVGCVPPHFHILSGAVDMCAVMLERI